MNTTKPVERRKRRKSKPIGVKSILKMLRTADSLRNRIILSLLINTGQRRVDIAKIKQEDINLVDRTIQVPNQQKTGEFAYLPLPEDLIADLKIYIHEKIKPADVWLFPSRNRRKHLREETLNYVISQIVKKSGVGHITPHDFRHTFLTRAGKLGIPPKLIIEALGIRYETVMRYYQSFTQEDREKELSKVHIT